MSLRGKLMLLSRLELVPEFLALQSAAKQDRLSRDFPVFAHEHQLPQKLEDVPLDWRTWLILAGRGAGKTRAGAEWVRALALGDKEKGIAPVSPIALVGETEHDVREVMIEGHAGIMAVHRIRERPVWTPSRRRLEWSNGAYAQAFSAEDPESLRGPQFAAAWCDELAKWRRAGDAYFGARFGVLGVYVSGRTREKAAHLTGEFAPGVVNKMVKALVKKK